MTGLPELRWERVAPRPAPTVGSAADVLRDSLGASATLARFLDSAATADEPVLLIVNDTFRSTQTRPVLTTLAGLVRGRRAAPRFRALVATGTHQIPLPERREFQAKTFTGCGLAIDEVAWHDADDETLLMEFSGLRVHHRVGAGRFLLPIGSVEPHYFAGVTGAHKTATIGCLARRDIERNHAKALSPASDVMCLQGNPVFEGIAATLRAWQAEGKHILAVDEVVRGGEILAAAVGDPSETIDALLPTVRHVYTRRLDRPVDLLRLRVPPPLGRNLYQADKALKNNHRAVRDGGGILLEAACPEGVGQDAFLSLLQRGRDFATIVNIIARQGYRLGDHKAVKLRHLTDPAERGVRIALVGARVRESEAGVLDMKLFASVPPAIAWLASCLAGPLECGLVVEDAGCVTVTPEEI